MLLDPSPGPAPVDVYAPDEIAEAAGVPVEDVLRALENGQAISYRGFVTQADAVRLVTRLRAGAPESASDRIPVRLTPEHRRKVTPGLSASGVVHAFALALILLISSGALWSEAPVKATVTPPEAVRLVYLMSPGPGGGGGGSGIKKPDPPPRAKRAPEKPKLVAKVAAPIPPVRKVVPPPPPKPVEKVTPPTPIPEIPKPEPPKVEPKPPVPAPQAVQAPVVPTPADTTTQSGVLNGKPEATGGSGSGGAPGTGRGSGMGEGQGPGIGPGSGGGTGGGPYRAGSGIEAPKLVKEVPPVYTPDARRRGLEGDVVLEIVITNRGTVDRVRVLRGLGAGLDENAIAAVKQWRFEPARRLGSPVDVVVEVSVEFRMRDH